MFFSLDVISRVKGKSICGLNCHTSGGLFLYLGVSKYKMNNLHTVYTSKNISFFNTYKIGFETVVNPKVSILIPVYNQIEYTLNCLYSLVEECKQYPVEIIVINDCSTDETLAYLEKIEGLKIINNKTNLGFLKNINKGIEAASGEYVLLLNNDVIVIPNLLKELFYVFENKKNVGAVGSMAIHPTGVVLEAGSTLFSDGTAANMGRECIPNDPRFNFIKSVDYCSGYCLLLKRFFPDGTLVLLDEQFLPAYYEETDLCMRIKHDYNLNIFYQPFAKLIHFESISYGKEKTSKKQKLMDANKEKFFSKWQHVLKKQPYNLPRLDLDYLNKDYKSERILILDDYINNDLIADLLSNESFINKKVTIVLKRENKITVIEELQRKGVEVLHPYTGRKNRKKTYLKILYKTIPYYSKIKTNHPIYSFFHKLKGLKK